MSYDDFVRAVILKIGIGNGIEIQFLNEDGKYIAKVAEGVTIIGNSISAVVLVKWGSGHCARANLLEVVTN